jgi:hypothetical protein
MSINLEIKKIIPGMRVHWIDEEGILASSRYTLYLSRNYDGTFTKIIDVKTFALYDVLACSRLLCRTFRLGIRALLKLKNGVILVVANGRVICCNNGRSKTVFFFEKGVGPLRDGLCEDNNGNIYIGEYFINNSRKHPVKLFKSEDCGENWMVLQVFKNIRHIHCVQYDPYENLIWIGTGDRDEESSIMFSEDYGETWKNIGSGNQMFRTLSLLFTEDYVYWGTDTPARQSYIYRYKRKNGTIERLSPVNGPVYYSTSLENNILFFSTGAEGKSEGVSGAWDNKAHIWASIDGTKWEDIVSWEKDSLPYILGYGKIVFARGKSKDMLVFTTECLKGIDNKLFICRVEA